MVTAPAAWKALGKVCSVTVGAVQLLLDAPLGDARRIPCPGPPERWLALGFKLSPLWLRQCLMPVPGKVLNQYRWTQQRKSDSTSGGAKRGHEVAPGEDDTSGGSKGGWFSQGCSSASWVKA